MKNKKKINIIFLCTLIIIIGIFLCSIIKTNIFNSEEHIKEVSGKDLFTQEVAKNDVSIKAVPRTSTWGKIFDFNNEGLKDNNYQSFTYDFTISNQTNDEVKSFSFKLVFSHEAYLAQAWNGSLEIHQFNDGNEIVEKIPDLRDYNPEDYKLKKFYVDGEAFITLHKDDYVIYYPSVSSNALEMPIKKHEGTTPGMILYVEYGQSIEDSSIILDYKLYRLFTETILFKISITAFLVWFVAAIIVFITSRQIKKYKLRQERDFEIITESIETFTGFIDAKDKYTNGHSKRVAIYTRLIAEKMGITGEELDKVYYIALLHDCGKIAVPDNVLGKPGKLTDEEFEIIKSHTTRGGEILSSFKSLENVGDGAHYHHERYDGKGYPVGLKGEEIPLIARMICVADAFDAMNSNRVYRKRMSKDDILNEIEKNKGSQFDPKIADIMLALIKEGKINMNE